MFSSRPLVLGAALALLVPAAASAATATAGGSYSNQQTLDFATVAKSGKSAALNVSPGKCAHGTSMKTSKAAKISGSKLTYSGAAANLAGDHGTVVVAGVFTSAKKLKWTAKITVGSCHTTVKSVLTLS
jgi:hypothetical protein